MKSTAFFLLLILLLVGCSENREHEVNLSSDYGEPIRIKLETNQQGQVITQPGSNEVDMFAKSHYKIDYETSFSIVRSDGKTITLKGTDFKVSFYHYSKLLEVWFSPESGGRGVRHFNNPISWYTTP